MLTNPPPPLLAAALDGYRLGVVVSHGDCGDAWVQAPDGQVAGLVWATGDEAHLEEVVPDVPGNRRRIWLAQQPLPLTSDAEAEAFLRAVLPALRSAWAEPVPRAQDPGVDVGPGTPSVTPPG